MRLGTGLAMEGRCRCRMQAAVHARIDGGDFAYIGIMKIRHRQHRKIGIVRHRVTAEGIEFSVCRFAGVEFKKMNFAIDGLQRPACIDGLPVGKPSPLPCRAAPQSCVRKPCRVCRSSRPPCSCANLATASAVRNIEKHRALLQGERAIPGLEGKNAVLPDTHNAVVGELQFGARFGLGPDVIFCLDDLGDLCGVPAAAIFVFPDSNFLFDNGDCCGVKGNATHRNTACGSQHGNDGD